VVTSAAQASLKRTDLDSAIVIGNDDLAVDQRPDGHGVASLHKLWEPRRKIAAVAAQQLNGRLSSVPEQATEAIELRLVPHMSPTGSRGCSCASIGTGAQSGHEVRGIAAGRPHRVFGTLPNRQGTSR